MFTWVDQLSQSGYHCDLMNFIDCHPIQERKSSITKKGWVTDILGPISVIMGILVLVRRHLCIDDMIHILMMRFMTITRVRFYKRYLSHQLRKLAWKFLIQNFIQISQGLMSYHLCYFFNCHPFTYLCFLKKTGWELTHKQLELHRCLLSITATDVLVLKHQAISSRNDDKRFIVLDQLYTAILQW